METYTLTKNNSFIIEGRLFLSEHCTCNPELYVYGKRMVKPNIKKWVNKIIVLNSFMVTQVALQNGVIFYSITIGVWTTILTLHHNHYTMELL